MRGHVEQSPRSTAIAKSINISPKRRTKFANFVQKLWDTGLSGIVDSIVVYGLGLLAVLLADYILPRKLKIGMINALAHMLKTTVPPCESEPPESGCDENVTVFLILIIILPLCASRTIWR